MQFVTEGISKYAGDCYGPGTAVMFEREVRRGKQLARKAGYAVESNDLGFLVSLLWRDLSKELHRNGITNGAIEQDYLVAGDVLDSWVTDHDAELLAEIEPSIKPEEPVGGMSPELTAIHTLLLEVCSYLGNAWADDEEDAA